jgi:TRAP-type C4-dicarboxylate transport system permease small subunit
MPTRDTAGLLSSIVLFFLSLGWYTYSFYHPFASHLIPYLSLDSDGIPVITQLVTLILLAITLVVPIVIAFYFSALIYRWISGN